MVSVFQVLLKNVYETYVWRKGCEKLLGHRSLREILQESKI